MKKENDDKTIFKKKGQPNLVSDDFMKKIKTIMIGTRAAGTAISRSIVMTPHCNGYRQWSSEVK